tara:strand:- start:1909 stop:2424 length:516 start_codon:yes stop_codon:yes gene_type:complete
MPETKTKKKSDQSIEELILDAVGEENVVKGKNHVEYRKRLVRALTDLDDDEWKELDPRVQQWFNDSVDSMNDDGNPPPFPDAKAEPAATADEQDFSGEKPGRTNKRRSAGRRLKELILESVKDGKPTLSAAEALARLNDEGLDLSKSTVELTFSDMRQTIAVLIDKGIDLG